MKVFAIVGLVLVLLLAVLLVVGGGEHGPSRHAGMPRAFAEAAAPAPAAHHQPQP